LDTIQASTTFDTTGSVIPVSQIAQGLDFTNRVGDSIKLQNVQFNFRIYKNAAATSSIVRIILFRDNDCQGATPTTGDVLQNVGAASAPLNPRDFLNRKRFAILYDRLATVNNTGDSSFTVSYETPHEGHILFLGTTASAASQGKGSMFVLVVSDEAVNTPSIAFFTRLVFTDD
jgi:hypothetical protein